MCLDILPYHSTGYKRKRERNWGYDESYRRSTYKAVRLTKPIIVYKVLRANTNTVGATSYTSPYRYHKWVMGRLEKAPMVPKNEHCTVHVGLHAFLRKRDAEDSCISGLPYPAVIPAGSLVYFGTGGEIVSDQMIAFKDEAAIIKRYGGIGKKLRRKDIVDTLPKLIKDY
jgi:hypothetical protein